MAATNIKDFKNNTSSTIYNGAPFVDPDMVANAVNDGVDSVNQNTDGIYQYKSTVALSAGGFSLVEVDGVTITAAYKDAARLVFHETDLGGFDYSYLQNASTLLIHLGNNDGTKATFECSFLSYASNIVTLTIDVNHYVTPETISVDDYCKIKMINFDSVSPLTFSNGLTKTGNDVELGGTLTDNATVETNGFSLLKRTADIFSGNEGYYEGLGDAGLGDGIVKAYRTSTGEYLDWEIFSDNDDDIDNARYTVRWYKDASNNHRYRFDATGIELSITLSEALRL